MNIFVLDLDPAEAAKAHCDRHVVKMVTETCQLLSTALRAAGDVSDVLYRPTHAKHPCTVWTAESQANARWLADLGDELIREYEFRYQPQGPKFERARKILRRAHWASTILPSRGMTPFAQAMPDDCKSPDPVQAYRNYYKTHKTHLHSWRLRKTPSWI